MNPENTELFGNEWVILRKVLELEPCVEPMVQEKFQGERGWVYITVKTMIDMMTIKGL